MSKACKNPNGACRQASFDIQTVAVSRLGFRHHRRIRPPLNKHYVYVLAAMDYFTKWVEARPYKSINSQDIINFIKEFIFARFGLPETLTVDQARVFNSSEIHEWIEPFNVKITKSTPYYAQANGQAESTNKIIKNGIGKMIDNNPRVWHQLIIDTLWVYQNSKRGSTGVTPYQLVCGHDRVQPMEINIQSTRIALQNELTPQQYQDAMAMEVLYLDQERMQVLNRIEEQKRRVEKCYNRKVRPRSFTEEDLVWKVILPEGPIDHFYGKWAPKWEGPYIVSMMYSNNANGLKTLEGKDLPRALNGRYLKKYTCSI